MTTNSLALDITQRLIDSGVTIISLPGGTVQLLGKYGTILLTQDITTVQPKQIEQLSGLWAPLAEGSGNSVHQLSGIPPAIGQQNSAPTKIQAPWYEP
jgi:hypothetical protein